MKTLGLFFGTVCLFTSMLSCNGKFGLESKKENTDSLFLGISLGMGKKEFYDHCWKMNKEKLVTHGPSNQNVEYDFKHEKLKDSVIMRFYPTFNDEKIYEMPVLYTYSAWAPWNKGYWADSLLAEMVPVYEEWYGGKFKVLNHKVMGKVYYKMDGKRRINLFKKDDQFVQAVFTDLKVEKELKEKAKQTPQVQ